MKNIFLAGSLFCLVGCGTTNPGSGAALNYKLPSTGLKISVDTTLKGCLQRDLLLERKVSIVGVPSVSKETYQLAGESLNSFRAARSISIKTYDNGVIKSLGIEVTDKTPAIAANILKTIGTVTGFALSDDTICNDETREALEKLDTLESFIASTKNEILKLDGRIVTALGNKEDPKDIIERREALKNLVNDYAAEWAKIKSDVLFMTNSYSLPITNYPKTMTEAQKPTLRYSAAVWNKWIKTDSNGSFDNPSNPRLAALIKTESKISIRLDDVAPKEPSSPSKNDDCAGAEVIVPSAKLAKVSIEIGHGDDKIDGAAILPFEQFNKGDAQHSICLKTKFGENRKLSLAWDKFGRANSFEWQSTARGEAISGAVAGYSESAKSISENLAEETEMERKKAEIDQLKQDKELNELRACADIINAGGYKCTPVTE